ncbi:hypothetical protein WOLCODRAFT_94475 [Wolfiporia cocos MD-104 SS10]|uniref:Alpha/beta-hydrolase n=1 Tax=Wolfiporia cocos (strain MD-104) TaxID=742152 RepID=A0A2H3JB75_WOLCO|nr:hypothetical protein WOLCODRAFT_94475 [Wolfiporia cocos MD-104 SS10]
MTTLPSFLRPVDSPQDSGIREPCINATFYHKSLDAAAHALWWPSSGDDPSTILLFIPGNPGLIEFYVPFLTSVHEKSQGRLAVLAHAHLGHSPTIPDGDVFKDTSTIGLTTQVQSAIEAVDTVSSSFPRSKIAIAAHSMGCWVTCQVLKARPDAVATVFWLFPTITNIVDTPNGRSLWWLFRPPLSQAISAMSIVTRVLPDRLLSALFPDWPLPQLRVLRTLLNSPSAIQACLTLANDEMNTIKDLDITLLQKYRHRIHLYFAQTDDWVGKNRETILRAFHADPDSVKIVYGQQDIPHAFCINHGEHLAEQCSEWLQQGGFI